MTDSTAAAREQVLDIVAQWNLHRPADMKELLFSALMAAEQRGREAAVSAGWRLVPVEPTETMHDAARDWSHAKYGKPIGTDASAGCWAAMLAAAPQSKESDDGK